MLEPRYRVGFPPDFTSEYQDASAAVFASHSAAELMDLHKSTILLY